MPDGAKVYAKSILSEPEKYFTEDFRARIDECAVKEFTYGSNNDLIQEEQEVEV